MSHDWIGFFSGLYDNRNELYPSFEQDGANWDYVANPAGGFFGYWWYFKSLPNRSFLPYLQLEQNTLCFKIMVDNEVDRRMAREEAHYEIMQNANGLISKPDRLGNGKFMTVARWNGDYRVFSNGQLNMPATLENLKKAQAIVDTAFPNQQ